MILGSLPVYTGPFSLEYYENIYPADEYDWEYDWDEHFAEPNQAYTRRFSESNRPEMTVCDEPNYEKIETSGESKIDKCKAFMKNYCLPFFALCWTILLFVGLGSK